MDFTASLFSGSMTQVVTNPIWVAKTRLQSQKLHNIKDYKNILDALNKIARREGIYGLFKGLLPSLIGTSHFMIYMPLYDYLNRFHDLNFRKYESMFFLAF